jgi:hypothetical protein
MPIVTSRSPLLLPINATACRNKILAVFFRLAVTRRRRIFARRRTLLFAVCARRATRYSILASLFSLFAHQATAL